MIYRFEGCTLDTDRRELWRDGALRHVEPQVFDLLCYLIDNRERVVSRDDIFNAVWQGRIVSDGVLNTRLNAARAAIGDSGRQQRLIRTLPRHGVRFVGELCKDKYAARAHPPITIAPPSALMRRIGSSPLAPTIIVVPLAVMSKQSEAAHFAEWLSNEMVAALWQHQWLAVIAPSSPTQCAREPSPNGRHQGDYALEGSVKPMEDGFRVVVRVLETKSRRHVWAHSIDLRAADNSPPLAATTLAAQVADHVFAAEALRGKMRGKGRDALWSRIIAALAMMNTRDKQQVGAARRLLRNVVAADPDCAPGHALLSFIATLEVHLGWRSQTGNSERALALARKAITCDSEDSWGHLALGYATLYVCSQPADAVDFLQEALRLSPNLSMAHYLIALSSAYMGDTAAAFDHADMAEVLAPHDLLTRGNAGAHDIVRNTASFAAGRYDEGIAYARAALAINPRHVPAYRGLIINATGAGEAELARCALRRLGRLAPDTGQFVEHSKTLWFQQAHYEQYKDAFRIAGSK